MKTNQNPKKLVQTYRFTLGRKIDLKDRTNQLILLLSGSVFLYILSIYGSLLLAGSVSLSLFLLWAVGRELDPARWWSAFALALAWLGIQIAAIVGYLPAPLTILHLLNFSNWTLLWVLINLRWLTQTCGANRTRVDFLALIFLTAWNSLMMPSIVAMAIPVLLTFTMYRLAQSLSAQTSLPLSVKDDLNQSYLSKAKITASRGWLGFALLIFLLNDIIG